MKAIAAVLFAAPSLRWNAETVAQPGFAIFWAVSIPATISVFGVWKFFLWREKRRRNLQNAAV